VALEAGEAEGRGCLGGRSVVDLLDPEAPGGQTLAVAEELPHRLHQEHDQGQELSVETLGFRLVEAGPGHALFECEPAEYHYNPIGIVHAGLALTLMDSAMGLAFVTTLDEPAGWTTLEVKANFTRPLTVDTGLVRCAGSVVHPGRRVATTEARVEDAQGRLCAHGTSTILVLGDNAR